MIIRMNAGRHDLIAMGSTFDMAALTKLQQDAMREMVVNYWAKQHGFAPPYPEAA